MTQAKTFSIKALLLSLLLVPAMFLFSACGSQLDARATVDNTGNYSATTEDNDFTTFLADEGTTTDFSNGLHMTMDMTIALTETTEMGLYINAYIKYAIDEATSTLTMTELAAKMTATNGSESETVNFYVVDGFMYVDSSEGQYKSEVPADMGDIFYGMGVSDIDVDELLDLFTANTGCFDVEVATSGTVTKYHISVNEASETVEAVESVVGFDLYFIFNNGQLTGLYMSTTYGTISIVGFDGDISYPNFSGYEETAI